jgi:hypothetical protein
MAMLRDEQFTVLPVIRVSGVPDPEIARAHPGVNRYLLSTLLSLETAFPREQRLLMEELLSLSLDAYLQLRTGGPQENSVFIFDQFEEILTVDPVDITGKEVFFAQVGEALRNRQRWALFAMREDFRAALDPYLRLIPTQFSNTFRLDFLDQESAIRAIARPAAVAGIPFVETAVQQLVDNLRQVRMQCADGTITTKQGPYVEPVQLQVVCFRLWEHLPSGTPREVPGG